MLSKTGLHAIKALAILAELPPGEYAGAVSIAKTIGAPQNYLGKLLQQLNREGLVDSQKGIGGGFRLSKPADRISLLDIADPIENVSRWGGCILGNGRCSTTNPCMLHDRWKAVREHYLDFLETTTVADLIRGAKKSQKP